MARPLLSADKISPAAAEAQSAFHRDIVDTVAAAVARDKWVIVGMAQNPVVKKARKRMKAEKIEPTYIGYGSYFSEWKKRLAIKLWAGWPTFPMVFRDGVLIGGCAELEKLLDSEKN
jgi:glutaredoxin-related protein